jgi:hypothetical protein
MRSYIVILILLSIVGVVFLYGTRATPAAPTDTGALEIENPFGEAPRPAGTRGEK